MRGRSRSRRGRRGRAPATGRAATAGDVRKARRGRRTRRARRPRGPDRTGHERRGRRSGGASRGATGGLGPGRKTRSRRAYVARAERRRERPVRGPRRSRSSAQVDAVLACERERQARQRRPAPAGGRAAGVRAQRGLDRPGDHGGESFRSGPSTVSSPSGFQSKTRCGASGSPVRPRPSARLREDAAATRTPARSGRRGSATNGTCSTAAKPRPATGGSSSRSVRIWEVGASTPGSVRASSRSWSGVGSEPKRSSRRATRLSWACASGVSSQTQRSGSRGARRPRSRRFGRPGSDTCCRAPRGVRRPRAASSSAAASSFSDPPRSSRFSRR